MNINVVVIGGNLVKDVEKKLKTDSSSVAHFTVAVNRVYHTQNEERKETNYIDVVAFGKTAEICLNYLKKGSEVIIEGRLKQDKWEVEGQTRSRIIVIAESIHLTQKKDKNEEK